jgi:hypothetical protein
MISPLTPLARKGSVDRTPRPSVVAVSQKHSSQLPQSHGYDRISPASQTQHSPRDVDRKPRMRILRERESSDALDSDDSNSRLIQNRDREISRARNRRGDYPSSDTASRHTFGSRGLNSSSASVCSFTTSSRAHSSDPESSSDDEGGHAYRSGPPTAAHGEMADTVDDDEEIDVGLGHAIPGDLYGRRGSLPLPIPGASSTDFGSLLGDNREGGLASCRRPSRSLDDDMSPLSQGLPPTGGNSVHVPRSEPSSRGDWVALEAQAQQNDAEAQDPLAGLNLGYILGGQDISGYRRPSDTLSYVQPLRRSSQGGQAFSFALGWSSGRRSSTATTTSGPDDTFLRHLNKCNEDYITQIGSWTFKREKADGFGRARTPGLASPLGSGSDVQKLLLEGKGKLKEKAGMVAGTQEIWKCEYVGRFKVDRQTYRRTFQLTFSYMIISDVAGVVVADPLKPPHQRVNVRHILDPYSRGNTRGGPSITIHKHSRAIAFSIYRAHNLTTRHRLRPGILLAPKKVQERFTSTKTTAKLATHGLLEDRGGERNPNGQSRRDKDRHKSEDKTPKTKMKLGLETRNEDESGHTNPKGPSNLIDSQVPAKDTPVSDVTNTNHQSSSNETVVSQAQGEDVAKDPFSRETTSDQSTIKSLYSSSRRRDSLDVDPPPSRTPHAETYGTLDSSIIEYVRTRPDRLAEPDSNTSFFKRLLRPLPRSALQPSGHTAGLTSAQLEGNYKPPWMAMAPRARQEETDRVIHNLNNSFKGVGLLPTNAKPSIKSKRPPRPRNHPRVDILEHVPEDSLYMLLPLWPGETDSMSSTSQQASSPVPAPEDRHYLLVYYVPRPKNLNGDQQSSRKRLQTSSSDSPVLPDDRNIILSEFHVCARLVSYNELRGSGVRLPSDGLSVTGPMWEAVQSIPDPAILLGRQSDWVIALYHGRERGIELMPDGLMKLGLCLPLPPRSPPSFPLREEELEENLEPLLSSMGRAAVEMAWAGCIALSSFGPA